MALIMNVLRKNYMSSCVVIPARFSSSRFPGKPLVMLNGKPMIVRVCDIASRAVGKEHVYVATDNEEIASLVISWGYQYIMTSPSCLTGTDRIAEAVKELDYDIVVNVQGDEPLVNPTDINKCIELKRKHESEVVCGYTELGEQDDVLDANIPKVLMNEEKKLIYMSRMPLPAVKDKAELPNRYFKQVCIYGFSKAQLRKFAEYGKKAVYEQCEDIEILRFFELGETVQMFYTQPGSIAVDIPDDVVKVEAALNDRTS